MYFEIRFNANNRQNSASSNYTDGVGHSPVLIKVFRGKSPNLPGSGSMDENHFSAQRVHRAMEVQPFINCCPQLLRNGTNTEPGSLDPR
jgi:hypothetical protein